LVRKTCLFLWRRCSCRRVGRCGAWARSNHTGVSGYRCGVRCQRSNDVGRRGGAKGVRRWAFLVTKEQGRSRVRATRKFNGSLVGSESDNDFRGSRGVVFNIDASREVPLVALGEVFRVKVGGERT
jgi:hypothetical protein